MIKNREFLIPPAFDGPDGEGFPSKYCDDVCYGKTRLASLPDSERNLMTCYCLAVSTKCRRVTDGQTSCVSIVRAMHSIAWQKLQFVAFCFSLSQAPNNNASVLCLDLNSSHKENRGGDFAPIVRRWKWTTTRVNIFMDSVRSGLGTALSVIIIKIVW